MVFLDDICRFSAWVTKCGNSTLVLPQNICLIGQVQGNMRRKRPVSQRGTSASKKEEGTMGLGRKLIPTGKLSREPICVGPQELARVLSDFRTVYPSRRALPQLCPSRSRERLSCRQRSKRT